MRIAFYCTNEFKIPVSQKHIYAPLRVAEDLINGLVARGHQIFLYAAQGTKTKAHLIDLKLPSYHQLHTKFKTANRHDQINVLLYEQLFASQVIQDIKKYKFDLIHFFHLPAKLIPLVPFSPVPVVFTLHDPLDASWLKMLKYFPWKNKARFVSISNNQRKSLPGLNFAATVYNGIDFNKVKYYSSAQNYLVFLGRLSPEKGADLAVKVALKTNNKLKIAGNIWDKKFFEEKIKPCLGKYVEYLGLLPRAQALKLAGQAKALLFPVRWQEPFGLVVIEAMAGGTPVIAFKRGSSEEVIKNNYSGFIAKDEKEMIKAVKNINQINRYNCRRWVEENFSLEKMVEGYEKVYQKILKIKNKRQKTHIKNVKTFSQKHTKHRKHIKYSWNLKVF